jgi:hypothetical protein
MNNILNSVFTSFAYKYVIILKVSDRKKARI